jgi:hypothetical protein
VSVAGTASINNGGSINPSSGLKTSQPNIPDPYAGVALPAFSGCNYNGFNTNSWQPSWTLSPGVYCNGLSISNGATAAMNPGVYFIDRGTFAVGGGARVTGAGVTIVLTSSTGGNNANAVIDNGTTVTLSAPTTGATAGMVFYGDRRASAAGTSSTFAGRTAINFTGAIYLPTQTLNWNNGANNTASSCTELIAGAIVLGGANLQINCPTGVGEPALLRTGAQRRQPITAARKLRYVR